MLSGWTVAGQWPATASAESRGHTRIDDLQSAPTAEAVDTMATSRLIEFETSRQPTDFPSRPQRPEQ